MKLILHNKIKLIGVHKEFKYLTFILLSFSLVFFEQKFKITTSFNQKP